MPGLSFMKGLEGWSPALCASRHIASKPPEQDHFVAVYVSILFVQLFLLTSPQSPGLDLPQRLSIFIFYETEETPMKPTLSRNTLDGKSP